MSHLRKNEKEKIKLRENACASDSAVKYACINSFNAFQHHKKDDFIVFFIDGFLRNSRKYGLGSLWKTPTDGTVPTSPGPTSGQLSLILLSNPTLFFIENFFKCIFANLNFFRLQNNSHMKFIVIARWFMMLNFICELFQ